MKTGRLFVVGTPIGNIEDITLRAIRTLFQTSVIVCEDTRRTSLLLNTLKDRYSDLIKEEFIEKRYIILNDFNETNTVPAVVGELIGGRDVTLVSDAGTPLIADPGFKLLQAAIIRGVQVVPIPGVSALTTALSVAGTATNLSIFVGYLPEKESKRENLLLAIRNLRESSRVKLSVVMFAPPHKLISYFDDLYKIIGECEVAVLREMTKIHEEILRGKLTGFIKKPPQIKGEFTLVVSL